MKTLFTSIVLFVTVTITRSQGFDTTSISISNIAAMFDAAGMISFDTGGHAHFEFPKGAGINGLFASTFWMAGLDAGNNLHLAGNRYYAGGTDFFSGPIATNYNTAYDNRYNHIWKVSAAQVLNHQQHFADIGYVMPADILNYPGNGNTANGEAQLLAPFADLNSNSIYEPASGDYPLIKGDEALYIIYNDARGLHTETNGQALGVEVHLMVYGFNLPSNPDVYNSLFMNLNIINRSANNYTQFGTSWWNDFDLGCFANDRVGCDTILNTFFGYSEEPDSDCNGATGYTSERVSLGVTFLNTELTGYTYFQNLPGGDPHTDPTNATEYYNLMNALWRDGTPFTVGGNGYNTGAPTSFVFAGDPCDTADWSDVTSSQPGSDKRAVGSTIPFTLNTGSSLCLDMAYTFSIGDTTASCPYSSVDALKQSIQQVKNYYLANNLACATVIAGMKEQQGGREAMNCFPNPANNRLNIELKNGTSLIKSVILIDISGRVVMAQNNISKSSAQLDVRQLAKGLYVLEVETAGATQYRKVMID